MNTPGGKLLQVFLMSSYLYYKHDVSPIPDEKFDKVCAKLLELWDTFEHQHKYIITKEDLKAGSGFAIEKYPLMVERAALTWMETLDLRTEDQKGGHMYS